MIYLGEDGLKIMKILINTIFETGEWHKELTEVTMIAAANICRNTPSKSTTHVTTKHSPLNKYANAKNSLLTEQCNP